MKFLARAGARALRRSCSRDARRRPKARAAPRFRPAVAGRRQQRRRSDNGPRLHRAGRRQSGGFPRQSPHDPKLSLFVGGNYYFAMAPLVETFEKLHPEFKGHIYWETIPPGLLVKQIKAGGTITVGNMTWTVKAGRLFRRLRRRSSNMVHDGHAGAAGGSLCHQHADHHGAEGQSGAHRLGPRRSRQARRAAGHAQPGL